MITFEHIGIKFGIIGLIDDSWFDTSVLEKDNYILTDPVKAGRDLSRKLAKDGCRIIIALTHMANESDFALLNDKYSKIDFILGGHKHMLLVQSSQ